MLELLFSCLSEGFRRIKTTSVSLITKANISTCRATQIDNFAFYFLINTPIKLLIHLRLKGIKITDENTCEWIFLKIASSACFDLKKYNEDEKDKK